MEPLKEPVFEAQSNKNTHYVSIVDDATSSHMNDTGMMREAWNMDSNPNMSFNQKAETTGFLRPHLESHYHTHMNQLILSTRRIGISVEGYF